MVNYPYPNMVKAVACLLFVGGLSAQTPEQERRLERLEQRMRQLDPSFTTSSAQSWEERLAALELKLDSALAGARPSDPKPQMPAPEPAKEPLSLLSVKGDYESSNDSESRMPVAGYMEAHFNKNRGEPGQADFHRFVLLFGHNFSRRIKFWSELEVEHSFVEGGEESGEVALEQAYLDFLIKPYFNLRAGMLLTPVGLVNERHEPPSFNGVERPFVETFIIPTTWRELGFGVTGDLGHGIRYRGYLMSALNATRLSAEDGLSASRTSGFEASFRNPAKALRVEYAGVRRLVLGFSGYTGRTGNQFLSVNPAVSIASVDGRYSYRRFDLRGLFANTWISQAGKLNMVLQRQNGLGANVGSEMRGAYIEPAIHVMPRKVRQDLILFTRYERFNTQHRMPAGFLPLAEFDRKALVTGFTFKPHADIALKFDYVLNYNASSVIRPLNALNLGLGWWF